MSDIATSQQLLSPFTSSFNSAYPLVRSALEQGPDDRVFTREDGKIERSLAISGKLGTECAALLGLAGWRAASVISNLH